MGTKAYYIAGNPQPYHLPDDMPQDQVAKILSDEASRLAGTSTTTPDKPPIPDRLSQSAVESGKELVGNLPGSGLNQLSGLWHAATNPVDTIKTMLSAAGMPITAPLYGVISELEKRTGAGMLKGSAERFKKEYLQPGLDFGQAMSDRYGGMFGGPEAKTLDQLKFTPREWGNRVLNTLITDPVGVGVDLLGAKPGVNAGTISKVESGIKKAGDLATKAPGAAIDAFVQSHEGIGPGAFKEVAKGAREGTPGLWKTLTQGVNYQEILSRAEGAIDALREKRSNAYNASMSKFESADAPVTFDRVDRALGNVDSTTQYRGKSGLGDPIELRGPNEIAARDKINAAIEEWRNADPREFHTAYGFDKLKQKISNIMHDVSPTEGMYKPLHVYGGKVLDAVRDTIKEVASPDYVKAMDDYSKDTNLIRNTVKEFKLGPNNTDIQATKALQKIYRRTADVAHGEKENLLRTALEQAGDSELMQHLAAGQFNPNFPQGLRGLGVPATIAGILGGALTPWAGILLGAASPKLTGSTAYGVGKVGSAFDRLKAAYEAKMGPPPYPGMAGDAVTAVPSFAASPAAIAVGREAEAEPDGRARGGYLRRLEGR